MKKTDSLTKSVARNLSRNIVASKSCPIKKQVICKMISDGMPALDSTECYLSKNGIMLFFDEINSEITFTLDDAVDREIEALAFETEAESKDLEKSIATGCLVWADKFESYAQALRLAVSKRHEKH